MREKAAPAGKILIVEDNPLNMRLVEMLLKARGDAVLLKAGDGKEALEIAARELPTLIIMDVQLPRLSGVNVVRKLRRMPPFDHVPIVALTAYAMKGDRERLLQTGFDAYLSKPVSTRELSALIDDMLMRHRAGGVRLGGAGND